MCGGCWDSHAKMNNNRLLVTTEHEHTRRLSLLLSFCRLLSHLLSLSLRHPQTAFSLWFTNTSRFHFSPLSLCVSLSRLTKVKHWHLGWRSYHTFHSSTLRSWPVISVVGDTEEVTICVCACVCVDWDHRESFSLWFNISSDLYLPILSMFVDWDKSVGNCIDCGVYWKASNDVCSSNIKTSSLWMFGFNTFQ